MQTKELKQMKVLITGGTGFIGLNIIEAALQEGYEVHALIRETSNRTFIKNFDVTYHTAELDDFEGICQAVPGMDYIIHCAGVTSCYEHDYAELSKVNVEGTKNIVKAAIKHSVKRLIYTGTTSTIGAKDDPDTIADESFVLDGFRAESPYARTKTQAEKIVSEANRKGVETIILNPAEVIGPYDHNVQWGQMVMAIMGNQIPFVPPGSATFSSAKEVGKAHVKALTAGTPDQRYILGGEHILLKDFLVRSAKALGVSVDLPQVPYDAVFQQFKEQAEKYPDEPLPPLDPYRMRVFKGHYLFGSDKARKDLDYKVIPLEQMVVECADWYTKNGFLD
jgi:dihydroflavonol-4-reductase